ncbi:MAG: VOC family protein [Planctomycetota bacterium]|jgi:glyoxylase I family protein
MPAIQHIAFNCRDMRAQEEFYARHFGFRRVRTFKAGTPKEFAVLRLGGTCTELFPAGEGADEAAGAGPQPVGFAHLAFEVEDLDAAVAALEAGGVETEGIIDCSRLLEGFRVCFFNDPEGNRIELMQGYRDEAPE